MTHKLVDTAIMRASEWAATIDGSDDRRFLPTLHDCVYSATTQVFGP
jgi:hypothetical protein